MKFHVEYRLLKSNPLGYLLGEQNNACRSCNTIRCSRWELCTSSTEPYSPVNGMFRSDGRRWNDHMPRWSKNLIVQNCDSCFAILRET